MWLYYDPTPSPLHVAVFNYLDKDPTGQAILFMSGITLVFWAFYLRTKTITEILLLQRLKERRKKKWNMKNIKP